MTLLDLSPTGQWIAGGIAIAITVICVPFISPFFRRFCCPYGPASKKQISNILLALKGRTGSVLDLGSGDGRIVIATAKIHLLSHGIDLNPWLVIYSKINALMKGMSKQTQFFRKDLWTYDISGYDNIIIFGVQEMMSKLETKFQKECKEGCNIITCRCHLPNITPTRTIGNGIDTVWVYEFRK